MATKTQAAAKSKTKASSSDSSDCADLLRQISSFKQEGAKLQNDLSDALAEYIYHGCLVRSARKRKNGLSTDGVKCEDVGVLFSSMEDMQLVGRKLEKIKIDREDQARKAEELRKREDDLRAAIEEVRSDVANFKEEEGLSLWSLVGLTALIWTATALLLR